MEKINLSCFLQGPISELSVSDVRNIDTHTRSILGLG